MEKGTELNDTPLLRNCFVVLDKSEVDRHKLGTNCRKQVHICSICDEISPSAEKLRLHFGVHPEASSSFPFQCGVCGKYFKAAGSKREHVLNVHMNTNNKPYACEHELCGSSFASRSKLIQHEKTHDDEKNYCHTCPICQTKFTASGIQRHMKTHTGEKPHKCSYCDSAFPEKCHRRNHEQAVHEKQKLYKCDQCEKCFNTLSRKINHEKHHGEKQFRCELCLKSFYYQDELSVHVRMHTDERPYNCKFCVAAFKTSSHRKSHERRIHGSYGGLLSFACTVCESHRSIEKAT